MVKLTIISLKNFLFPIFTCLAILLGTDWKVSFIISCILYGILLCGAKYIYDYVKTKNEVRGKK